MMDVKELDLCTYCVDLVTAPLDESQVPCEMPHHSTYGSLSASSSACALCQLIKQIWPHTAADLQRRRLAEEAIRNARDGFPVKLTVSSAGHMPSGISWKTINAWLVTGDTPLSFIRPFTVVACSAGDPAADTALWSGPSTTFEDKMACIKAWMHTCCSEDGHGNCQPIRFAPLRLVTVGLDGKPLRLVERDDRAPVTVYATLSYRWGFSLPLRTTKQSLDGYREALPVELMPKTFTDAIRIARDLGIPHIWIDALCIVQDDEVEWQSEAAQMAKIYQGSQLTITATQSASTSQGCFHKSRASDGDLFFRTRTNKSEGRISLVRAQHGNITNRTTFGSYIGSRGWTMQEQLLSHRVVFCMDPDIHWQCQTCYETQSGVSFTSKAALTGGYLFIPNGNHQLDTESHRRLWRRISSNYSRREFTHPRDRVPAFAGICQTFAAQDNTSLLGLWSKSFATDVGWLRLDDRPHMASIPCLPSWTWLASPGYIGYITDSTNAVTPVEHLRLESWILQWHGTPYVSQVKLAEAHVRGPVREIALASFVDGSHYIPRYLQVFGDNLTFLSQSKISWRCYGQFDAPGATIGGTYLCLLLFSVPRDEDEVEESFLILEPVELGNSTRYKRIGMAKVLGRSRTFDLAETRSLILV